MAKKRAINIQHIQDIIRGASIEKNLDKKNELCTELLSLDANEFQLRKAGCIANVGGTRKRKSKSKRSKSKHRKSKRSKSKRSKSKRSKTNRS